MASSIVIDSGPAAAGALPTVEADLRRGALIDLRAGLETLRAYADEWIARRPDLEVRTKELYPYLPMLPSFLLVGRRDDTKTIGVVIEEGATGRREAFR